MTKKQRFMEMVRIILNFQKVHDDDFLTVCDCFVSMPDKYIPETASLRHFAHDCIDYFLGRSQRCEMSHSRTAKYISKWRSTWVASPNDRYSSVPPGHPAVIWTCDNHLVVSDIRGDALSLIGLAPEDFAGRPMSAFWGSSAEDHPVVGPCVRALRGETVVAEPEFGGYKWHYVVVPRVQGGRVVGANATAVALTGDGKPSTLRVEHVDDSSGIIAWRTDRRMRVVSAAGRALQPSPQSFVGLEMKDVCGPEEGHVLDQFERSLNGETISRRVYFRGQQWQLVTSPRVESPGVLATAVRLAVQDDTPPLDLRTESRFSGA